MGRIDYPETSVTNYQLKLRNIPEERRSQVDTSTVECTCIDGTIESQTLAGSLPSRVLNFSVQICFSMREKSDRKYCT
jgi:hypothetical protein